MNKRNRKNHHDNCQELTDQFRFDRTANLKRAIAKKTYRNSENPSNPRRAGATINKAPAIAAK